MRTPSTFGSGASRSGEPASAARVTDASVDRRLYAAAVSRGIDATGWDADTERVQRPIELLAAATLRTPALAALAPALAAAAGWQHRDELEVARTVSAGLVRLAHRALEVHGRDVGYDIETWIDEAIVLAGLLTIELRGDPPRVLDHLDEAAEHLAAAIVAIGADRLAFPDRISRALAGWLACFARSTSAVE